MSTKASAPKYDDKPPPYTPTANNGLPPTTYQQAPVHTIPPGYYPTPTAHLTPLPGSYVTSYGATAGATQVVMPEIIIVGACPACRVGVLEDDYTCLGIFCAIFFFPLGILCCLLLKNKRCSNCGAYFG